MLIGVAPVTGDPVAGDVADAGVALDEAPREALMTLEGAALDPGELARHQRVWVLFDGRDAGAVERARSQWRALTQAGEQAQYWSEESGRWEMKAESR